MAWTPSIIPSSDPTNYIVVDDLGDLGRIFCETQVDQGDLETIIADLISGQYSDPIKVIAFNLFEGWCRDVSADIAAEIKHQADIQGEDVSSRLEAFVDTHLKTSSQLSLRLV